MFNYHITPKAPLIFRDGKPFGTSDNIADTLLFPLPSTIAGAIRTAWAESQSSPFDYKSNYDKLIKKRVIGPFLSCTRDKKTEILFPTPADSICLNDGKTGTKIYRLGPKSLQEDEGTDIENDQLTPVFPLTQEIKGKPAKNSPKFWTQQAMIDWLQSDTSNGLAANSQGVMNLPIEIRTHVSIDPQTQAAKQGHLFQTRGLDFGQQRQPDTESPEGNKATKQWGWKKETFGLACSFQEDMSDSFRTIAGESRLGFIKKQDGLIPECPQGLKQALNKSNGFRLILTTPAIFTNGYLPDWLDKKTLIAENFRGMKLRLHAISLPRWQAGTSWDMASSGSKSGKGMRSLKRLVPAGTVYWFERLSGHIQADGFWLTSISEECRLEDKKEDGFGLTLPGVWNIPPNLKTKKDSV